MKIGFKALEARFGIRPAQPLRVESTIGTTRSSREAAERIENQCRPVYRPADTFAGQVEFGLKYGKIQLEFFARLLAACGPGPLEQWCRTEPFGRNARSLSPDPSHGGAQPPPEVRYRGCYRRS